MNEKLDIHLTTESVVNERTGEVSAPSEYLQNLRALERAIANYDNDIAGLSADLSAARKAREKAVASLRTAVRDGQVLPLLEAAEDDEDTGNADASDHIEGWDEK